MSGITPGTFDAADRARAAGITRPPAKVRWWNRDCGLTWGDLILCSLVALAIRTVLGMVFG